MNNKSDHTFSSILILLLSLIIFGCGGDDIVEEIIDTYENGDKKVLVKFKPDVNVLERYAYNRIGELVYFEVDSLLKREFLRNYLNGDWSMKYMVVDEDTLFNMNDSLATENSPNVYTFSTDSLHVNGWKYQGRYRVKYIDSLQVDLRGAWRFDDDSIYTYRFNQVDDKDTLTIQSYSEFVWNNYLNTVDKEESVVFSRAVPKLNTNAIVE